MAETLKLEIVTPQGVVFSEDVHLVTLPAIEGQMGIYPHHMRLITEIEPGSPAASAQLRVGDFISHANQTPVRTPAEFHTAVEALSGNVTLQLIEGHNDSRQVVIGK